MSPQRTSVELLRKVGGLLGIFGDALRKVGGLLGIFGDVLRKVGGLLFICGDVLCKVADLLFIFADMLRRVADLLFIFGDVLRKVVDLHFIFADVLGEVADLLVIFADLLRRVVGLLVVFADVLGKVADLLFIFGDVLCKVADQLFIFTDVLCKVADLLFIFADVLAECEDLLVIFAGPSETIEGPWSDFLAQMWGVSRAPRSFRCLPIEESLRSRPTVDARAEYHPGSIMTRRHIHTLLACVTLAAFGCGKSTGNATTSSSGGSSGTSNSSSGGGTTSGSSNSSSSKQSSSSSGAPSTDTAGAPGAPMAPVHASGASITPTGTIWYVRSDGGTPAQCNGKTDHPLAGASGSDCAFSDPAYLWSNDVAGETAQWKIAGGDTVILRQGPYRIGYKSNTGAAQDAWGYCQGNNTGCTMPPIPSGTSGQHTKILGENYANCTTKTQLHGGYGLSAVVELTGAQNVDLACLELTDWASCSRVGVGNVCAKVFPGWDDYADNGIDTDGSTADINLIDLDIHGLTTGIAGPIGGIVNADHVRLHANGSSGWNFDNGSPLTNPAAQVKASYLIVEYSGCTEEYPVTSQVPIGVCYDQQYSNKNGGWAYGDGVGTPSSSLLNFTCDHCNFNHNTQDGFDLLHTTGSIISITNSVAYANEGQQFKLGAMAQVNFQDNIVLGNCHRMAAPIPGGTPGYNAGISDNGTDLTGSAGLCRADGTALALGMVGTGTYTFQNNTVVAYGDIMWGMSCWDPSGDCSGANVSFENNLSVAYPYPSGTFPKDPVSIYFESGSIGSGFKQRSNNVYYNFRNPICPTGFSNESCTADPLFVSAPNPLATYSDDTIFDAMDLHLQSSSPARGAGVFLPSLPYDWEGTAFANPPDIGAL